MAKVKKDKTGLYSSKPKGKKEVKAEYEALEALQKKVPHFTHLGDDNWEMIGAQIQTLKWEYTMAQIDHWWPDKTGRSDGNNHGAAEDALFWKEGGDIPSPSFVWALQVGKKESGVHLEEKELEKPVHLRLETDE